MQDSEVKEWRKYINRRTQKAFCVLNNEPLLYRFLTENNTLSPNRVDKLLANTDNPECRAILLDHAHKNKKNRDGGQKKYEL